MKLDSGSGLESCFREEVNLMVDLIADDFRIHDLFSYDDKTIKVYKNSENVFQFKYATSDIFDTKGSTLVPITAINNRIRNCNKYPFKELFKLNTHNPFDNYLVSKTTLLKLVGYNYNIHPDPIIAYGYKIYNE